MDLIRDPDEVSGETPQVARGPGARPGCEKDDRMTELLTAAQMRAIEQAAIASGEVTGLELMERAGRGVVEAILEWRPELATTAHRAVVLCGPGNNGGDGFVVARLLKQRGWEIEVFLYGDEAKLPPDAAENCRRWREMGEVKEGLKFADGLRNCDLFIDALFGTGLNRPLPEDIGANWNRDSRIDYACPGVDFHVVSIDIESGRCSDSGTIISEDWASSYFNHSIFGPDLIVTFHREKQGHHLRNDRIECLKLKDIGLNKWHPCADRSLVELTNCDTDLDACHIKLPGEHKYEYGHALILAGGVGRGGAARLAARAALRVGAGLVTVAPPPSAMIENAAQLNAIMLRPVTGDDALTEILKDERINAVCLRPGFRCWRQN